MNQLIDILVDDEKNGELVDMIADKLVNKLLGFGVATPPQPAQAMPRLPAAEVRQFMQSPQFQFSSPMQAPDLQVNVGLSPPQVKSGGTYDQSKNVKIDLNKEGVVSTRNKNY